MTKEIAYKGFNSNLMCRNHQFAIGETYTHTGIVRQCESGFHACQNPLDVLDYYPIIDSDGQLNRFARVTMAGKIDRGDGKKWAAAQITINAELTLTEFIKAGIDWIMRAAKAGEEVSNKNYSKLAASGHYSKLAASGCDAKLAASGDYSQLAASGYSSKLAASGHYSKLAASGHYSQLAASGHYSKLAASGHYSKLAASGHSSQLAASGDYSKLAASGDCSQLAASGEKSAAAAVGAYSRIKAASGTPIAICEYDRDGTPLGFATGIAGQDGVPADVWLIARDGKLVSLEEGVR